VGVLSDRIRNIHFQVKKDGVVIGLRHPQSPIEEAATIAAEADELMADMAEALDGIINAGATYAEAEAELHRYNQFKERAQ